MAVKGCAKAKLHIHKILEMKNGLTMNGYALNPSCYFEVKSNDGKTIDVISFAELCKAIAKQLVKDGAIPGGE